VKHLTADANLARYPDRTRKTPARGVSSTVDSGWYRQAPYSGESNYDFYIKQVAAGVGRPTSSPGPMSVEVLAHAIGTTPML